MVSQVVVAADGNPLLAVESARAVAAGSSAPPPSLRAVVRAALGALPEPARALAEAIAAAGRGLTAPEVVALPATDEVQRRVLDSGLARRAGGRLAYRHALLAEAARADLRDPEGTHLAVALAVEAAADGGDASAAEVARHLQWAGRDDLAAPRWRRAAGYARSLGALPEAAAFWTEALRCDPDDTAAWLELAEVHAWSGRTLEFERAWTTALTRLAAADQAAAWCRRGLLFRTVACNPAESFAAYQRAEELLTRDAPAALRAEVMIGLAWTEASAGDPAHSVRLLAEAEALAPEPNDITLGEMENARLMATIRLGRFAECEAVAQRAGTAIERLLRPDLAYPVWINAASALACAGDLVAALRCADRGIAATRSAPVVELPCLAARAHLLARLGRHDEAADTVAELLATAERLDSAPMLATARHDAGLVALTGGRHCEAAKLLVAALDGDAAVSRPAARLAAAEAFALCGATDEATAELRRGALEPVRPGDQPWALVPRMARVQGLVARARGDVDEARRRFGEAAEGWRRRGGTTSRQVREEYMASLVDLGRPPIVGLVEPDRELARVTAELAELEGAGCPSSR
jgi:tetratricopeptide (TPR) repeat protein